MEEIKLWKVDGFKESLIIADVSSVGQTKTEEMLERDDIATIASRRPGRQTVSSELASSANGYGPRRAIWPDAPSFYAVRRRGRAPN